MSATRNSPSYVAYHYQQSLCHYITCQDTCVQLSHAAKRMQGWAKFSMKDPRAEMQN